MRKIVVFVFLLNCVFGLAQTEDVVVPESGCPIYTISTNPLEYQNSADPNQDRKWNWLEENYTVYSYVNGQGTTGVPILIRSPFYDISGNPNTYGFSYEIEKDNKVEDGWELLFRNFGNENQGVTHPYFVLYNRYTGVIRVFVNIINSGEFTYNAAKLQLRFDGLENSKNQTALLNQLGAHSFSFMDFQKDASHFVPNMYVNSGVNDNYFWVWADFNTMYDPCTCGVESNMRLNISLINEIDINLNGFLTQKTLLDAVNATQTTVNDDFWSKVQRYLQFGSGVIDGVGTVAASGTKAYKDGTKMLTDVQQNVQNLAPMLGRQTATNIANSLRRFLFEFPKVNQMLNICNTAITVVKKLDGQFDALNASPASLKSPSVTEIKTSVDISGNIDVMGNQLYSLLNVPGSENALNTNVNEFKPVYNNVLGVLTLSEQPEFEIVTLPVGGTFFLGQEEVDESFHRNTVIKLIFFTKHRHDYLDFIYNETPQELNEKSLTELIQYYGDMMQHVIGFDWDTYMTAVFEDEDFIQLKSKFKVFPHIKQLRLKNNPIVLLNPASNLKIKEVQYQVVFTHVDESRIVESENDWLNGLFAGIPTNNILLGVYERMFEKIIGPTASGNFKYFESHPNYEFIKLGMDRDDFYSKIGYNLNLMGGTNPQNMTWEGATFSTPYLNQACFSNSGIFTFSEYNTPRLRVKVILEPIVDNPNSEVHELINILTFPSTVTYRNGQSYSVENIPQNPTIILPGQLNNLISGVNSDILLQNETIGSNLLSMGDITIGENVVFKPGVYTIKATGNIYYNKTVNFEPLNGEIIPSNFDIQFIAGHEIITAPESYVQPEIDLMIDPTIINVCESTPDQEVTGSEIAEKCNSDKYKALISKAKTNSAQNLQNDSSKQQDEFDFTLYPNPSQNRTSIRLNQASSELKIKLHDVSGKEVSVRFETNSGLNYSFDVSNLEKGVYFVTVTSGFEQITKQLIVQ